MKVFVSVLIGSLLFFSCKTTNKIVLEQEEIECSIDTHKIEQFVTFLERVLSNSEFKKERRGEDFLFDQDKCFTKRFGIHDLTTIPVINTITDEDQFKLKNNHVYHFYALYDAISFSHIAYIDKNGSVTFFESINCKDRGDNLQDVLDFLEVELNGNPKKQEILKRVNNYRDYYISGSIDGIKVSLKCDCDPCD